MAQDLRNLQVAILVAEGFEQREMTGRARLWKMRAP